MGSSARAAALYFVLSMACSGGGAPDRAKVHASPAAADAARPYGYGPEFRVRGARAHFDTTAQWWGELDGTLVFFGDGQDETGVWVRGLWRTDGAHTTLLRAMLNPGGNPFGLSIFTRLGGVLYFPARDWSSLDNETGFDVELWRTDGTPGGTYEVTDLNPGLENPSSPTELVVHRGSIYFVAEVGAAGHTTRGIYVTDGTAAGTRRVVALRTNRYFPAWLTSFGDQLLYTDDDPDAGLEPHVLEADGRAHLLKNLSPESSWYQVDSYPTDFTVAGGRAYFSAEQPASPYHGVFTTDGTAEGTAVLAPLLDQAQISSDAYRYMIAYGDRVLVHAVGPGGVGWGLWVSDGTEAGTTLLHPGSLYYQDRPVLLGDRIVFRASEPVETPVAGNWTYRNHDLWASDGTPASTALLKHFCDACDGVSGYGAPVAAGDYVFFAATDDANGRELWRTDGTPEGTALVEDLVPGTGSPEPYFLGAAGELVYFAAGDGDGEGDPMSNTLSIWAVRTDLADRHPPELTCPARVELEALSAAGAPAEYQVGAVDNLTAAPVVSVDPPSGSTFPLGTTTVTATATDEAGNAATCTFPVVVLDRTAPVVTCPADAAAEATSPQGAPVDYPVATATDVVSVPIVTYDHARGVFPLGRTEVTATATDAAGNHASCTFAVTVADTTAPALACPADAVVEATSADGAIVTFGPPAATDAVSTPVVSAAPASGSAFALGEATVTVTATDGAGNASSCTFHVRVADTTAPSLSCPGAQHAVAAARDGAVVYFPAAVATDAVTPAPSIALDHATGSLFPVGTTPVTVTAADAAGNTSTCAFDVVVDPPPAKRGSSGGCQSGPGGLLSLLAAAALLLVRRRTARA